MSIAFVIGAVASASAVLGMGISFLVTRNHYRRMMPKRGEDGLFQKRD